jgi:hypothetical protein
VLLWAPSGLPFDAALNPSRHFPVEATRAQGRTDSHLAPQLALPPSFCCCSFRCGRILKVGDRRCIFGILVYARSYACMHH